MRTVAAFLIAIVIAACTSPKPSGLARRPSGGRVECEVPGGLVDVWDLIAVEPGTDAIRVELTFEAALPHERWRPVVWVMLAEVDERTAVRVDVWQPEGWDVLAMTVRRLEDGGFTWHGALEHTASPGEAQVVTLQWSQPDRVEIRVGAAPPVSVPIDFAVRHAFAGCSGVKARVRLLDGAQRR